MNYDDFKKKIEAYRAMRLTDAEKKAMLAKVFGAPVRPEVRPGGPAPVLSPLGWQLFFVRHRRASFALSAMLVFFLVGGSAMYAAEGAVPGELLYPVKVGISEPARDLVRRAPEARAAWEREKAERRLEEAKALALRHELDEARRTELEKKFEKHSDDFDAAVAKLPRASTSTAEKAERAKREFDSAVILQAEDLDELLEDDETPETEKGEIKKFKEKVILKIEREGKGRGKGEQEEREGKNEKEEGEGEDDEGAELELPLPL